jgi:G:T-mismatch repair DNA endonuclease (very short patch repair protein)
MFGKKQSTLFMEKVAYGRRGKTYEEVYGDKAETVRKKIRESNKEQHKRIDSINGVIFACSVCGNKFDKSSSLTTHKAWCKHPYTRGKRKGNTLGPPSRKGTKHSQKTKIEMSEKAEKRWKSKEYRRKVLANRGEAISNSEYKGRVSSTVRKLWDDPTYRKRMVEAHTGKSSPKKGKSMLDTYGEERAGEIIKRWAHSCGLKPNKAEKKFFEFLNKIAPSEFALNVRGEIMVLGGKIPDFVNINGKKQIIELYGDYWHRGENPQERINFFKGYGWDTMVVWEKELKNFEHLKIKIVSFVLGEK